jgi:hypothetical protein
MVPNEFWESKTPYEFEVLAIEASGNQTLVSGFFETGRVKNKRGKKWINEEKDND